MKGFLSKERAITIFSVLFLVFSIIFLIDSELKTNTITGFATYIDVDFSKVDYSEVDIPVNNSITFSLDGRDLNDLRIIDPDKNTIRTYINGKIVYFNLGQKKDFDLNLDGRADISITVDNFFSNKAHVILTKIACTPDWYCTDYTLCTNNIQTRECFDKNNCNIETTKPEIQRSCTPTCDDGVQNQGESGIDCGGPCTAACSGNTVYLWAFVPVLSAIIIMVVIYLVIRKKERPYRALEKPLIKEIDEEESTYVKEAVKESGIVPKSKEELEALQQLEDYINEALSRRVPLAEIKENLIQVGWEERIVDLSITKIVKKRR